MMIVNPIMTLFFSLSFSGALALYWAAGNLVMIIQQVIVTFVLTPSVKKHIADELKDKPIETVITKEKWMLCLTPIAVKARLQLKLRKNYTKTYVTATKVSKSVNSYQSGVKS